MSNYILILSNHYTSSYYHWSDLTSAKRDAQKVADGWHESVTIAEILGGGEDTTLRSVCVVKPRTEKANVPDYEYGGNRTWSHVTKKG